MNKFMKTKRNGNDFEIQCYEFLCGKYKKVRWISKEHPMFAYDFEIEEGDKIVTIDAKKNWHDTNLRSCKSDIYITKKNGEFVFIPNKEGYASREKKLRSGDALRKKRILSLLETEARSTTRISGMLGIQPHIVWHLLAELEESDKVTKMQFPVATYWEVKR